MARLNRRTFLRLIGQGTAALGLGMGISDGPAWAATAQAGSGGKGTKGKYQIFQPGEYLEWEKKIVEERFAMAKKGPQKASGGVLGGSAALPEDGGRLAAVSTVKEEDILNFNRKWDPYNPLFNDRQYAKKAGYPGVPAFPCFQTPRGGSMSLTIPEDFPEDGIWIFAHGPDDIEFFQHIFAGDSFTSETEKLYFEELTKPGSDLRHFKMGSSAKMYNQKNELAAQSINWLRNAYKKIIDGSPKPSYSEVQSWTLNALKPAHYTTDEEWAYIKELWGKEYIRGSQKLYWEDVNIGDEPAWVCSNPISYMDMVGWYGGNRTDPRPMILKGDLKTVFRDRFGNYLFGVPAMVGTMNIVGARAVMYNDTSAKLTTRLVTNYIGDAGLVTRIGWMFQQSYVEMRYPREGGEYLDKVPYMKGKSCTDHPSEGDTVISKGYVTNKYKNDKGEGIIELVCWAETLDDRIIEVVPAAARLPLKTG